MKQNPLLSVKDLSVTFSTLETSLFAVRGVNFTLQAGEALGIVGESGCGKSATVKALLQLHHPRSAYISGEVKYREQNLLCMREKQMQKVRGKEIAMIFQDPMSSLNPTRKIGEQIIEGYRWHNPSISKKAAMAYALELLERVGIPHPETRLYDYPHTLSGGMCQRAMIAMALSTDPKILIADEPTTALDVTIQAQILDLLKHIQKTSQTSIILITHDLSVVAGFCDRVLVMYAGKIVECAPVDELFAAPKHPYTQRLLASTVHLDRTKKQPLLSIEGHPPSLTKPPTGCAFYQRCHQKTPACATRDPPLLSLTKSHSAACLLHENTHV